MKALALESVVKLIIFLATAVILLTLVLHFSDEIKTFIRGIFGKKQKVETEVIEMENIDSGTLATYINSCWDRTGPKYEGNVICYVLKGNMNSVNIEKVKMLAKPENLDVSNFDPKKGIAIIEFKDLGNKIVVRS